MGEKLLVAAHRSASPWCRQNLVSKTEKKLRKMQKESLVHVNCTGIQVRGAAWCFETSTEKVKALVSGQIVRRVASAQTLIRYLKCSSLMVKLPQVLLFILACLDLFAALCGSAQTNAASRTFQVQEAKITK